MEVHLKFALVNGEKSEPQPHLRGTCNYCGSEMVAKCGRIKTWHWAHKSRVLCDPWWESESEWHRAWKNWFPMDWQEVVHIDDITGEKHIADVKTPLGLVIEFQHSPITPEEMQSREKFYHNMIWVVDGNRGSTDPGYFTLGLSYKPVNLSPLAYQIEWWGPGKILHNWKNATAKVYIDIGEPLVFKEECLWQLVSFNPDSKIGTVIPIPQKWLIEGWIKGTPVYGIDVAEEDACKFYRKLVEWNPQ